VGALTDLSAARVETQSITFVAPEAEVLVADDFPSNLMVAEGLLMPYRMRVFTCLNGREAVELVRRRPFDLVFMDHMMPEMDGVEATGAIRAMEAEYCRTMPIIALTANAVSGMSEMFLANGFNDFLSKPIETAQLDAVLKKWLPASKCRPVDEQTASESMLCRPELVLPDIPGLDAAAGVGRMGGSLPRYVELLETFGRDAESGLLLLAHPPGSAALRPFITLVHALKSALSNIGADDLALTAARLEEAGRAADLTALCRRLPGFREELAVLTRRISEFTARARSAKREEPLAPEARQVLERLQTALQIKDFAAVDAALARLQTLPWSGKNERMVAAIADRILMAEFPKALEEVNALLSELAHLRAGAAGFAQNT
jgi:CheY-like chemotaxis protein